MPKIIDGKKLSLAHQIVLEKKISTLSKKPDVVSFYDPEDQPSSVFTKLKQSKATELKINFEPININQFEYSNLKTLITKLNSNPSITGIMFQLPLPKKLKSHKSSLLNSIQVSKDIDGLTTHTKVLPATTKAVLSIIASKIKNANHPLNFAVVGSEGFIGKSIVKELKEKKYMVFEIDKKRPNSNLGNILNSDVVISCTGIKGLIKPEYVKDGFIAIDVGLGDFSDESLEKSSFYTPKIGGVGPMTIVSLMENVVELAYGFDG